MPTNDERAERAREVLEMYAMQFGDPYDPHSTLIDVLTDLMHLATREPELGLEFDSSLKMAQFHFEAEGEECLPHGPEEHIAVHFAEVRFQQEFNTCSCSGQRYRADGKDYQ